MRLGCSPSPREAFPATACQRERGAPPQDRPSATTWPCHFHHTFPDSAFPSPSLRAPGALEHPSQNLSAQLFLLPIHPHSPARVPSLLRACAALVVALTLAALALLCDPPPTGSLGQRQKGGRAFPALGWSRPLHPPPPPQAFLSFDPPLILLRPAALSFQTQVSRPPLVRHSQVRSTIRRLRDGTEM